MRQKSRTIFLLIGLAFGSYAAEPATSPADGPPLTERQQSLLLQLSDAEANIKALNLALTRAGYKVGQAYDRIESNLTGNELMDRKGGGPVGWKDFYGKTAREYDNNLYWDRRPRQFQKLYDANNNQIARAKEQVAALGQDQATLLARRQKHEADQARLWAILALERIKDREIADEAICRFRLKGAGNPDAKAELLRPFVLFLRTADKAALDGLDSLQNDPAATFAGLAPKMNTAYTSLRTSLADSLLANGLQETDKSKAEALKTLCKQLSEECAVIADNSRNALDRDKAKEDNSKLQFRARLQESLAKFASGVAELDVQLGQTAKAWSVTPETGVATADAVRATSGTPKTGGSPTTDAGGWLKLLDSAHLGDWADDKGDKWTMQLSPQGSMILNHSGCFWGIPSHDMIIRAKFSRMAPAPGGFLNFFVRGSKGVHYSAALSNGTFTIGRKLDGKFAVLVTVKQDQRLPRPFLMEFGVVGDLLTLSVEGKEIAHVHDKSIQVGLPGFGANEKVEISDIELQLLDKPSPAKP